MLACRHGQVDMTPPSCSIGCGPGDARMPPSSGARIKVEYTLGMFCKVLLTRPHCMACRFVLWDLKEQSYGNIGKVAGHRAARNQQTGDDESEPEDSHLCTLRDIPTCSHWPGSRC